MHRSTARLIVLLLFVSLVPAASPLSAGADTPAKYIILFQGDGMAGKHIEAGAYYVCGGKSCLSFEAFPNQATMTHNNATGGLTDSAASATAMATGVKVNDGVISVRLPGDGSEMRSILEVHRDRGLSTGLVTAASVTDASPAAHGAHDSSRSNSSAIFGDYINQTRPNVILGGGGNGFSGSAASAAGYAVVSDVGGLLALETETVSYVAGGFGAGPIPPAGAAGRSSALPTLPQMTDRALQILDNDPDGFYLFVEHEGIDEASHGNDAKELVLSVAEFSSAVQVAVNWVNSPSTPADWSNTLFVVVGDHETGGITNVVNYGAGVVPGITFTTSGHTTTPVRVFAQGAGAEQIAGQIDNTDIFAILSPAAGAALAAPANLAATPVSQSQIDLAWADQSDNEETFEVERSADGITGWTLIGTSAANAATFSDLGIPENTLFFYRVRAVNGSGSSAHSNVASARSLATPSIMHIGDIDGTRSAVKKNWSATVTITVHDAAEKPVSGVLVAGAWSGGATGNVSCTTTTAGTCQVTKGNVKPNAPSVTFTVTSLAKAGSTFEPASNHDDDRDSNGMAITVSR